MWAGAPPAPPAVSVSIQTAKIWGLIFFLTLSVHTRVFSLVLSAGGSSVHRKTWQRGVVLTGGWIWQGAPPNPLRLLAPALWQEDGP